MSDRSPLENRNWRTPAELAALYRVSKYSIYRAVKSGELPSLRVRGQVRIADCDADEWVAYP